MATIKLKTSTTDAAVPASLSKGEVAINVSDGVWYYGGASAVQQNFKFGSVTVTGDTSLDGKLVVTGNTVMNGTLSATTRLDVGNGNGAISASSITGTILKGVLGSDAAPVTAYINAGEIDNVAIGSETRLTSLKTTSIDINPSDAATVAFLLTAHADAEGNWVTINNSEDEAKFEIDSAGRTTIANATLTNGNITTANIDGGNIDGTAIGTSSRSTGKFTTMDVNSTLVVTGNTVLNGTLSATTSLKVGNGNGSISGATISAATNIYAGTGVDDGVISANTVQGSYTFMTFLANVGALSDDNWAIPGTNGISNHTWNGDGGADGTTTGSSTISLSRTIQHSFIRIPAGARLVGVEGVIRSNINERAYAGLFTFLPDYEGPDSKDATLRILAQTPSSSNNLTNDPQSFRVMSAFADQHVFADGECIVPAVRRMGSSTQTILCSFTLILKY